MAEQQLPLFVVDVEPTIYDGMSQPPRLVPGTRMLLESFHTFGKVKLWSTAGAEHAREVAERFNLTDLVESYHDKPEIPLQEADAIRILGRAATLQIDDDPTARVGNWPFQQMSYDSTDYEP